MMEMLGSLTTEFRITGRILRETLLGLRRTGWMNMIIIVTMASILSIFGVLMALVMEMGVLVHNIGSELEISAYVQDNIDPHLVRDKILKLPHIQKIILIPKEKAWADMQKDYPLPDIENPLPDTIHIQLTQTDYIPQTVQKLRGFPEIAAIQYAKEVLDKIKWVTKTTSIVGVGFSLFLGFLTLFIISNTIHLLIQGKSREIEILRMMGVGNWYIRLPFLLQGSLYGLMGALVSYVPLYFSVYYLNRFFAYLGFQSNGATIGYVMLILVLMGILVGSGGAAVAIRKYLEV